MNYEPLSAEEVSIIKSALRIAGQQRRKDAEEMRLWGGGNVASMRADYEASEMGRLRDLFDDVDFVLTQTFVQERSA